MAQVVRDVREPRLLCANAPRPFERLLNGGVAGVGRAPQRRNRQHLNAFEQGKAGLRNCAHVGHVSCVANAITRDRLVAVKQRNAHEVDAVHQVVLGKRNELHARTRRISGGRRKCVGKGSLKNCGHFSIGIEWNRSAPLCGNKAQRAQIVHPQNMIGVPVSVEHRVHMREPGS